MSCLSVNITNLSSQLQLEVGKLDGIQANISRYDIPLDCMIFDILEQDYLKITCSVVCNVENI